MKHLLLTTAAILVASTTAFAQAPAPIEDTAPAVPNTAIGLQERQELRQDNTGVPTQRLLRNERQVVDCSDPGYECTNFAPVADAAPAAPNSAVDVQERRERINDDPGSQTTPIARQPGEVDVPATGAVPAPIQDTAPAEPDTAIGLQERQQLREDETRVPTQRLLRNE